MTDSELLLDSRLFQALDKMADKDEESLDAIMGHGYLTAQVISPVPASPEQICEVMFPEPEATGLTQEELTQDISGVLSFIDNQLNDDSAEFIIPVSIEEDEELLESELADWCAGFLEAHIEQEDAWLGQNEQEVAELLLPVAALSGLFADEPDFAELSKNDDLLEDMATQLPEVMVELYLLMRAEG
ncbi:YecA/YgfB family protein [Sansalvadorimonas verongulae]|uniref:YecA/YgfB family protein n=1 Tax=Sansalvadorimonas verongulae TaxID=2172824 RepID=UPI0012BBA360|nr:YecA family protein [Sansalvadorimonas verongulae]MTI12743.1 YecA family protein [Sansalvadorimonas verongulae]